MRLAVLWIVLVTIVLIPFVLFEPHFSAFAERVTASGSSRWMVASAVFGLLALDAFLPVPSSIVSIAAGALLGAVAGAAIVWSGMMTGCLLGYAVGARGTPAARKLVGDDGLARAAELVQRYGDLTIVLCRPVPVLAEASVVFAGLAHAPYGRFLRLTSLSNLGIAAGYSALGAYSLELNSFLAAFLGALALPAVFMLVARVTYGRRR